MKKVLIQAGHAGRTSGSTGAPEEQKWTMEITPKIVALLQKNGVDAEIVNADPTDAKIAGDHDLFLAVHYDADVYKDRGGFIDTPDPEVDYATKESNRIAKIMRSHYFSKTGIPEHNERSNKNTRFYYMWKRMSENTPCVILEAGVGFRTKEDHHTLWFEQGKVVGAIVDGILEALFGTEASKPSECEKLLATKDKQIAAQKGQVTIAEKKTFEINEELIECDLKLKELENKPGKPVEAIKDPMRYVVSMVIAALITYVYTQYPVLGELQPDQQALAAVLVGLVVKGIDKYQHETGSKVKLPF